MTRLLLIGFAGALGTMTRYGVGLWAGKTLGTAFPYGTLCVNVVGCFLIAVLARKTSKPRRTPVTPPVGHTDGAGRRPSASRPPSRAPSARPRE
jgi:fluoride ion exporter CrcB/FEX